MLVKQAESRILAFPILALGYLPQTIGHRDEMSSSKGIVLGAAPDLPLKWKKESVNPPEPLTQRAGPLGSPADLGKLWTLSLPGAGTFPHV